MNKKTFFLLFTLIILSFGCQKEIIENNIDLVFIEKTYPSPSDEIAKEKVKNFLSSFNSENASFRTPFIDTEVNEAQWLLEASANYLKNVNVSEKTATHVGSINLEIGIIVFNNELAMKGSEMTAKFATMMDLIQEEEELTNTKAMAVDIIIDEVSSSNSNLTIKIVYGKDLERNNNLLPWFVAPSLITSGVSSELNSSNGCYWTPVVSIYQSSSTTDRIRCDASGNSCLKQGVSFVPTTPSFYDEDCLDGDVYTAILIGNEFVDQVNSSTGGNGSIAPSAFLTGVIIEDYWIPLTGGGGTIIGRRDFLYVHTVLAATGIICY